MKIKVNYDLLEEAAVAKKGFSVKRYSKIGLFDCCFFLIPICYMLQTADNLVYTIFTYFSCYTLLLSFSTSLLKDIFKQDARKKLENLSHELKKIYVDTDCEKLQEAQLYKTEYDARFEDSIFPEIMQKKYMMVPVNNDWGNNERSLMQEHIIGSSDYALSYGEPEKNKVLSLTPKRVIQK